MCNLVTETINFEKLGGVVPVVVQDAETNEVLMVGFMNHEAFRRTVSSGNMWYFSRKRKILWKKGEQSGNIQILKRLLLDCDNDTILAQVEQTGGACDLGYRSCFDKQWQNDCFVKSNSLDRIFDPSITYEGYTEDLRIAVPTGSLESCTRKLLTQSLGAGEDLLENEYFRATFQSLEGNAIFFGHNPRDIPQLVASGTYDAGITGFDLLLDSSASVVPIKNIGYNKRGKGAALWAVAVPNSSKVSCIRDLEGATVVTELTHVTSRFFERQGIKVNVLPRKPGDHSEFFNGNTVVELIETGATLKKYGYKPLAQVLVTHSILFAYPQSYSYTWKRRRIEFLSNAFQEALTHLPNSDISLFEFPKESSNNIDGMNWESYKKSWFTLYQKEGGK